jgi:hypothetical protein
MFRNLMKQNVNSIMLNDDLNADALTNYIVF